jgi:radical SAM superfamily enzyme YgiQ (UPF0313 family)
LSAACTGSPSIFAHNKENRVARKKRVLMLYPEIPTTYWSFDHALPFIGKKAALPPLGLLTVAALLPETYEVELIDLNVEPLDPAAIQRADMVFLSAMIVQKTSFARIVSQCNSLGAYVVAGGPYPISSYRDIEGVDTFVLDEAELTLPLFLEDYEAGRPGKLYRDEGKPDITRTPPPRYDLLRVEAYDCMALQYSRGCPYRCEFCDIIEMFGRRSRTKEPQQFLRELDVVLRTGFRGSLFVVDDNFVGNKRKVKELLRRLVEWQEINGYPFTFFTEASIDLARDPELLRLMEASRFTMVFVGIETPDEVTLAHTQKTQNTGTAISESLKRIQRRGMEVTAGFILGFDTDPPDIFDRQIEFIQSAGIPVAMVGLLNALPGTQLTRRLEREGRLLADSTGNNTHDLRLNFVPRMASEALIAGYKRVLFEIYRPRNYFARCALLVRRLPLHARGTRTLADSRAFLRSLRKQALSPYGAAYLWFLGGVFLRRIRLFPEAVAMAIKGYHLFQITRDILRADLFARRLEQTERLLESRVTSVLRTGLGRRAASTRRMIIRLREQMQHGYRGLGDSMRDHLESMVEAFLRRCRNWLVSLETTR